LFDHTRFGSCLTPTRALWECEKGINFLDICKVREIK
jgi:hypothetical protein